MAIDNVGTAVGVFSGSFSKIGSLSWLFIGVAVLGVLGAIGYFFVQWRNTNSTWNIQYRIRQEDTMNGRIYIDAVVIKGRKVTLNGGIKMVLLEKPILGKRLMPLLNYYTRPNIYDLILTSDNRIFITTGIEGIDKKRKLLNVGIRYPGIDNDFDEMNQQYQNLNQQNKLNNFLEIVKAAATAIMAICLLVALIVGGHYWLEGKEAESAISNAQIEIFDGLRQTSQNNLEFANAMNLLIPKLEEMYGTRNLRTQIQVNNNIEDDT